MSGVYHPTPNPMKISLFLEETGMPYQIVPVDTRKGEQHHEAFRAINPNGKLPAIVDTDGGKEIRVFDSTAILIYLGEKSGKLMGAAEDRGELLSWLMFIGTGIGPYSGQAVHFQRAAPEAGLSPKARIYARLLLSRLTHPVCRHPQPPANQTSIDDTPYF